MIPGIGGICVNECILVVDDDREIVKAIAILLEKEGYRVLKAYNGMEALDCALDPTLRLIIIDVMMPQLDGLSAVMKIREKRNLPIIVLSAKSEDSDKILGLSMGADDYVTKPFNPQVLLARIQNLLARTAAPEAGAVLTHKGLTLYVLQAKMCCGDKEAELTRNELGILRLLMRSKGNVIPRDAIIDELWQSEAFIDENTLNVNIVRLRKKLAAIGLPDYLETKRGMGYKV